MLSARLAGGVAELARDVFLEPRRHAVGGDGGAGHESPRMVDERLRRRGFYERSTRHGRGHGGAAAEKGTTVQTPVHRLHSRPPASPWIKRAKRHTSGEADSTPVECLRVRKKLPRD